MMTIQRVAYDILKEKGHPMGTREVAKIALERSLVRSSAKDPIMSHSQTIEKNIREGTYNSPRLVFMKDEKGQRIIGLPEWEGAAVQSRPSIALNIEISGRDAEMIKLAKEAGLGRDESEAASYLIRAGFKIVAEEIDLGFSKKLQDLRKRLSEFVR